MVFKQILGRGSRLAPGKLSFNTIDYTGATERFKDPDWLGEPEIVTEVKGKKGEGKLATPEPRPQPQREEHTLPKKRILKGVTVYIADETYFELASDGRRLDRKTYINYAKEVLAEVLPPPDALAVLWTDREKREMVLRVLRERGIPTEALALLANAEEADPYDLLLHLAYGQPLRLREDRVLALRNKHQALLEKYGPEAREVLEALLEKY